jgi:hypothetical protein
MERKDFMPDLPNKYPPSGELYNGKKNPKV